MSTPLVVHKGCQYLLKSHRSSCNLGMLGINWVRSHLELVPNAGAAFLPATDGAGQAERRAGGNRHGTFHFGLPRQLSGGNIQTMLILPK